jgi:hypothetical protein
VEEISFVKIEERNAQGDYSSAPALVKYQNEEGIFCDERTSVTNLSSTGAGFYLERRFAVGQLLLLTAAIPRRFRRYDHNDELYRIWGLIQHCSRLSEEEFSGFYISVAFIGKYAPSSYISNPRRTYRISGVGENGLFEIAEMETSFSTRKFPRYWILADVRIEVRDERGSAVVREETVTENVGANGAAVFSSLKMNVGDRVWFICEQFNFQTAAIVRHRGPGEDNLPRLHLEFEGARFPLHEID